MKIRTYGADGKGTPQRCICYFADAEFSTPGGCSLAPNDFRGDKEMKPGDITAFDERSMNLTSTFNQQVLDSEMLKPVQNPGDFGPWNWGLKFFKMMMWL
jgi:hypothetical protein|tara:strand:+ start:338 stop:637 length:300 start_codon:yes stop_codon:yes gene_type:complete